MRCFSSIGKKRYVFPLLIFFLLLTGIKPLEGKPVRGISKNQCLAEAGHLLSIIRRWSKGSNRVILNIDAFRKTMKRVNGQPATFQKLAKYFKMEDGVVKPIRTGKENNLYDRIKIFAAKSRPGQKLTIGHILWMGLNACRDPNAKANLPLVFLTIHNVMRVLARPLQWTGPKFPGDYGHRKSDPMFPVFMDLLGRGLSAQRSLPEIMNRRGFNLKFGRKGVAGRNWSKDLFNNKIGIFQTLSGARNTEWNGGCHYYFWVGASGRMLLGWPAVMGGAFAEMRAKAGLGNKEQGAVEISHFICGSIFSSNIIKNLHRKKKNRNSTHYDHCNNCCKGHQLYCKRSGKVYSFSKSAIDKNLDGLCDICGKPYLTKSGKLVPGLYSAQRGDVVCRKKPW